LIEGNSDVDIRHQMPEIHEIAPQHVITTQGFIVIVFLFDGKARSLASR